MHLSNPASRTSESISPCERTRITHGLPYVLDALANEPAVSDILLRDYSELNVAQGQAMIAQRGMSGRVRFEQGDAFNPEELSALTPRPTLAIVSGLYELFPENEQVKNSLAGLANAIEPGGILIYTGQPWHPQLEMIAGVLTSHKDGKPWVMRVRSRRLVCQCIQYIAPMPCGNVNHADG